jgi:hypothetical protein
MKVILICLLFVGVVVGCKKSSSPTAAAGLAGSYKVSGTIVEQAYPCWPCIDSGVVPSYDTTVFDTVIRVVRVSTDTFRLYGLGYFGMDTEDGPNCPYPPTCGFFGIGQGDSLTWIPITDDPGGFIGGGALIKGDSAYFGYWHFYRNRTWTYSLAGKRE